MVDQRTGVESRAVSRILFGRAGNELLRHRSRRDHHFSSVSNPTVAGEGDRPAARLRGKLGATLPGTADESGAARIRPCLVSLQLGFSMRRRLLDGRWALTPPFHHYLDARSRAPRGCLFSVALSVMPRLCKRHAPVVHEATSPEEFGLSSPRASLRAPRSDDPPSKIYSAIQYKIRPQFVQVISSAS